MIKKQLGVLASSIVVAANSHALIDLSGGDALAVFNTTGSGSYYQLISGSNGDSLAGGTGFSIAIDSAAFTALGTIESFAVLAIAGDQAACTSDTFANGCYNYTEFQYVSEGGGLVFAGTPGAPTSNLAAKNQINAVQGFLDNANLGANGEGSLGDFDSNANVAGFLNFSLTGLAINAQQGTGGSTAPGAIALVSPSGAQDGVYVDGTTFNATAQGGGPVVPVPAAAWLFGSALMGLGVIRRKA